MDTDSLFLIWMILKGLRLVNFWLCEKESKSPKFLFDYYLIRSFSLSTLQYEDVIQN